MSGLIQVELEVEVGAALGGAALSGELECSLGLFRTGHIGAMREASVAGGPPTLGRDFQILPRSQSGWLP